MQPTTIRTVFEEITDFLATNPTPQEIIAYRLPDDLQERAHELLDRNGEGELTYDEEQEMYDFVRCGGEPCTIKHVTKSGGHQLKMPPLAVIGALHSVLATESSSDGHAASGEGRARPHVWLNRQTTTSRSRKRHS